MDMERYETRRRKGWFPWSNLGRVADVDDFHGVIWDKGGDEVERPTWRLVKDKNVYVEAGEDWVTNLHTKVSWFTNMWNVLLTGIGADRVYCGRITLERCIWYQVVRCGFVTKVQHPADRRYSLPVPKWEYWLWLITARSGSVNTHGSPGSYSKTCGWSRWSDKPRRMILEHVQWTKGYLLLNGIVSNLNKSRIGHQIGRVSCWLWIYRWWDYRIMRSILDRGPWVMSWKFRPEGPVEAGWIDVAKWW